MKLNCDLGEAFGAWSMGLDADIMPYIDQANVACGFHGGDPLVIKKTLHLAKLHNVEIGAHPSYPDLQGFGRRSMKLDGFELIALIQYQIAAIEGMAKMQGLSLSYIKPHGALYNDMMKDVALLEIVMKAVHEYRPDLILMIQATKQCEAHQILAKSIGITLRFEAFADRRYMADGSLMPRTQIGAVLNEDEILKQAGHFISSHEVHCDGGDVIPLKVDSICVHGDTQSALEVVKKISALLSKDTNAGG